MDFDLANLIKELGNLHDSVAQLLDSQNLRPIENSQAFMEATTYRRSESVWTAYSMGNGLFELVADQLMAFTKTITEPIQTIAPWTCVRALIEASALASWILDPKIDANDRVQRSFALRYEGLIQEKKYIQSLGISTEKVTAQIDKVEQVSLGLGFPKIINSRNGERDGIGQKYTSITDIITKNLNKESEYRLLSAMAHGHHWAYQILGFQKINTGNEVFFENENQPVVVFAFEKYMSPEAIMHLCQEAVICFARPIWYKCQLFGWDQDQLKNILNKASNAVGIEQEDLRFWNYSL
jgi:hypothetical protein